jgi:hypothetical protein
LGTIETAMSPFNFINDTERNYLDAYLLSSFGAVMQILPRVSSATEATPTPVTQLSNSSVKNGGRLNWSKFAVHHQLESIRFNEAESRSDLAKRRRMFANRTSR